MMMSFSTSFKAMCLTSISMSDLENRQAFAIIKVGKQEKTYTTVELIKYCASLSESLISLETWKRNLV